MASVADLRSEAKRKRETAEWAKRVGPGLSIAVDRELMLQHANDLEAEAASLEARAAALEGGR
jgi:hypothetical protein